MYSIVNLQRNLRLIEFRLKSYFFRFILKFPKIFFTKLVHTSCVLDIIIKATNMLFKADLKEARVVYARGESSLPF